MNKISHKPNTEHVLKALKDFQRQTVDYVFRRLYLDSDKTRRFLVADEVGLGKTLVARGLIAKAVDYLWDKVERIDVVYICSNADIARQNIARLYIEEKNDFTPPSRLTLLPLHLHGIKDGRRLNFVAFTPGTSFDHRGGGGTGEERALLFNMLKSHWVLSGKAPYNVFSASMHPDNFIRRCNYIGVQHIEPGVTEAFLKRLDGKDQEARRSGKKGLRQRFESCCEVFCRSDASPSQEEEAERYRLIGELRRELAFTCLEWLQPDLVIMDEFQRFKHLLENDTEAGELAGRLLEYSDEHSAARVILLSATPYRMYTLDDEEGNDSHYDDLVGTLKFLFNDSAKTTEAQKLLESYSKELHRLSVNEATGILQVKQGLETLLKKVIVRTERLSASSDRNGMLREVLPTNHVPTAKDIEHFLAQARVGRTLQAGSILEYWKSAPYLLNFMDEYEMKRHFKSRTGSNTDPGLRQAILDSPDAFLPHSALKRYRRIDPLNPRLRGLVSDVVDTGAWKLLWMPPALPYYRLADEFAQPHAASMTKRLVFSCWHVVPKAIAALVSYEVERQCSLLQDAQARNSPAARKKKRPLLRFAFSDGRLTGLPVMGMIYPAVCLAKKTDPVLLIKTVSAGSNGDVAFVDVFAQAKKQVQSLLDLLPQGVERGGPPDEDWYWIAPLLLDLIDEKRSTENWLQQVDLAALWAGRGGADGSDHESRWNDHVKKALKVRDQLKKGDLTLGRRPDDLADVVTWIGLSGPGCCCLRSLSRLGFDPTDKDQRNAAACMANAFLSLFNLPESMAIIRGQRGTDDSAEPYWLQVLKYCGAGCLQSVLDEYVHILRESLGRIDSPSDKTVRDIAEEISSVLRLRTSRVGCDHVVAKPRHHLKVVQQSMRIRYAMRFKQDTPEEGGEATREDLVRKAFNSPFWPFVLATTSIGQEGLDFHQYCHAIVHWNLPSNPMDLEQREGRIHRYKGHAIRKNLASRYRSHVNDGVDPWEAMFRQARKDVPVGTSEIVPFWVLTAENGAFIERHVPVMPASRDSILFSSLKRAVSLYRLAFGQLRQEDLVAYLEGSLSASQVEELSRKILLNLEPPLETP